MQQLLENPIGLLLVVCFVGVLLVSTLGLIPLLRGADFSALRRVANPDKNAMWRKAFMSGREAQKQQTSELDELHQRVAALKTKEPPTNQ
ncbi:MAG: hypothetical protein JNL09_05460 [Anaerolineales bacterium]|nr:hypothetical protein [Anaerolineales bacterium]